MNDLKSANSVKIGKIFTDIRNKKSFTIQDVAQSLVMNIKYIKSIESGNYSVFPSEAFARAYFLKYKNFLSINCEFPSLYKKEKIKITKSNKNSKFNFFLMSFRRNLIAILISISFIIAGSKIINTNINSKVKIETIPVKKITEEKVSVFRNYINEEVDQSIFFPVKNTYSDNNEANSKINIKNSLNLNFLENCWVEISSNNKFIIYQLFVSGDSYSINIEKPFKIVVGNATGIEGTYNGNKIDFISNANRLSVNTIFFNNE
jgi:cytoskeletal protein RodZ